MPQLLERVNFPKIVTVLAITFAIGFGLCGLNFIAASTGHGDPSVLIATGWLELLVMILSAVGLVVTLVTWGISGRDRDRGPQRLFDRDD